MLENVKNGSQAHLRGGRRTQHREHHILHSQGLQGLMVNAVVLFSSPKLLKVLRSSGRVSIAPRKGIETNKDIHYSLIIAIMDTFFLHRSALTSLLVSLFLQ